MSTMMWISSAAANAHPRVDKISMQPRDLASNPTKVPNVSLIAGPAQRNGTILATVVFLNSLYASFLPHLGP